jgi:hypothetical protein
MSDIIRNTFYFSQKSIPHEENREDHDLFICGLCNFSFESYVDGYIKLGNDVECAVHHRSLGGIMKRILDHLKEDHPQQYEMIIKTHEKSILKYIEQL